MWDDELTPWPWTISPCPGNPSIPRRGCSCLRNGDKSQQGNKTSFDSDIHISNDNPSRLFSQQCPCLEDRQAGAEDPAQAAEGGGGGVADHAEPAQRAGGPPQHHPLPRPALLTHPSQVGTGCPHTFHFPCNHGSEWGNNVQALHSGPRAPQVPPLHKLSRSPETRVRGHEAKVDDELDPRSV